jgi:hypothetical protein
MSYINLIILIFGFCLGIFLSILRTKVLNKRDDLKNTDDSNEVYKDILRCVCDGRGSFLTRINSNVTINMNLEKYGNVSVLYMMDKKDIAIFKGDSCIHTSDYVDKQVVEDITNSMDTFYKGSINDVIYISGYTFSKYDFEEKFNIKLSNIEHTEPLSKEDIFYIDDILDKINLVGLSSLTEAEKRFLDEYNK